MSKLIWHKKGAASYGRAKMIARDLSDCDVCQQEAVCLHFDSSDEEYGWVSICQPCANLGFSTPEPLPSEGATNPSAIPNGSKSPESPEGSR